MGGRRVRNHELTEHAHDPRGKVESSRRNSVETWPQAPRELFNYHCAWNGTIGERQWRINDARIRIVAIQQ